MALEQRCRQLTAARRQEERRRRQLEARLTALLEPPADAAAPAEQQDEETPRRLQTLLDKLHRQGVEVRPSVAGSWDTGPAPAGGGGTAVCGGELGYWPARCDTRHVISSPLTRHQ